MESDVQVRLIETYKSIQGEGLYQGFPTYFVRFAGCALSCSWCDTPYSWGPKHVAFKFSVPKLAEYIDDQGTEHVCITGGEPLLQKAALAQLLNLYRSRTTKMFTIETGGDQPVNWLTTYSNVSVSLDYKLASSGMTSKMFPGNFAQGVLGERDVIKFVVATPEDLDEAFGFLKASPWLFDDTNVFFQCLGSFEKQGTGEQVYASNEWPRKVSEAVLASKLPVRVNVQIHKILWNPFERKR